MMMMLRSMQSSKAPPAAPLAAFATFTLVVCSAFMWSLPLMSWLMNDVMGYGADLCTLHAEDVTCVNTDNYLKLAIALNRTRPDGTYWGCSCGEGVVADWACNQELLPFGIKAWFFSVSGYIGTPCATGAFAFVLGWPIAFSWLYGCGNSNTMQSLLNGFTVPDRQHQLDILTLTQAMFHFFTGCILMCTWCVFPNAHLIVTAFCCSSLCAHFAMLGMYVPKSCWQGKFLLITSFATLGFLSILLPYSLLVPYIFEVTWWSLHAFWIGECIAFTVGLGLPVVLMWLPPVKTTSDWEPMMQQ